jgi:hypothetical protein
LMRIGCLAKASSIVWWNHLSKLGTASTEGMKEFQLLKVSKLKMDHSNSIQNRWTQVSHYSSACVLTKKTSKN